ncbi:MAG: hypothetical protein K2N87_06015 [Eubacterium sp.]|nr:hypothetical protein [Eubacterium sp.]
MELYQNCNICARSQAEHSNSPENIKIAGFAEITVSAAFTVSTGCIYLGGTFVLAVLVVCTCAERLLASTLGNTFFFRMQLTVLPCVAMLPVLAAVAYVIPK